MKCRKCGAWMGRCDGDKTECPYCGAVHEKIIGPVWGIRRTDDPYVEAREAWREFMAPFLAPVESLLRWISRRLEKPETPHD